MSVYTSQITGKIKISKLHDDVIKWKHFPRYWPFVREIHRSPVNFPHKGQWRWALMFTLICARMKGWVNNREAGDLRRYRVHYDVIVMCALLAVCDSCVAEWSRVFEQEFTFDTLNQSLIWPYLFKVWYAKKYQHLLLMRVKMLNNTHCYSDVLPICLNITRLKTVIQLGNVISCNIIYIYRERETERERGGGGWGWGVFSGDDFTWEVIFVHASQNAVNMIG